MSPKAGSAARRATDSAGKTAGKAAGQATGGASDGPGGRLRSEVENLAGALGERAVSAVRDRAVGLSGRLVDYAGNSGEGSPGLLGAVRGATGLAEGKSPAKAALSGGMAGLAEKVRNVLPGGGGKSGKGGGLKFTSIIESIDVGVPVRVAYDQWTRFTEFPRYMKKVETVEQPEDEKLTWKAQVFWSHRNWESTIVQQEPDKSIVWRSKGAKGYVNGAVTFHELAPNLTRVLLVLEYHPQGLFEHTGNIWRAQGRRARLELKHFQRHVMTDVITHPDDVEGWRGTIRDSQVVDDGSGSEDEESDTGEGDERRRPAQRRGTRREGRGSDNRGRDDRAASRSSRKAETRSGGRRESRSTRSASDSPAAERRPSTRRRQRSADTD